MNIDQAITSTFHHQSNDQVEVYMKFVKCMIKSSLDNKKDVNLASLQKRLMTIGTRTPSLALLLFDRTVRVLLLQMSREPMNINNDDAQ